jgi:hypothetical protein
MSNVDDPSLGFGANIGPENLAIVESVPVERNALEDRTCQSSAGEGNESALEAGELRIAGNILQPINLPTRYAFPTAILRRVSGRYRSTGSPFQLELRVDVDGSRPMGRVSGDFFSVSGATSNYFGSFAVDSPTVQVTSTQATIEGVGDFTWSASAPRVKVTIPRTSIFVTPPAATFQFFTLSGSPRATYTCPFVSSFFRTVQWEQDSVAGAIPFLSYNTGSLPRPSGTPVRDLTVSQAFADAGIEMQTSGGVNIINTSAAGSDAKWSDSELHAAMVANFSFFANVPQWKVYLLVATTHVEGYRGIMFDVSGTYQRQGCAVFYDAIRGTDPYNQRAQLRTYVHELGHAFNLLHSWQKNLANPPAPLGPNSGYGDLSWMNYDWRYQPGGTSGYWAAFPFQFTDNELIHLRHGFYRNVVFGGEPFATGSAEIDPELFADRVEDNSGLMLELRAKPAFEFGEPVVVEIKLATTDLRGKRIHARLHPKDTLVSIAIRKPSGKTVLFRPLIDHCVDDEESILLTADDPAAYASAYIGYGKDGFYFEQPGTYQLRAMYAAPDGSRVVSQACTLRVRSPHSAADEDVAELFLGPEQGQLFCLLGSDSDALRVGNDAFDLVLDKYPKHPLGLYANLVTGMNAERDFKSLGTGKSLSVRPAQAGESVSKLTAVAAASTGDKGIDNITLNAVMRTIAHAEKKAGDLDKAIATVDKMVGVFRKKGLNKRVLSRIETMAAAEKDALSAE